ncbi:MAG TPA: NADPH-dependent F420 reductase [Methanospirillum sp.]|uniref:NADPH-dependent F420 reductase n=1 Tax=Methanospirillum sp. TaxID=45200 RepID=UPI002C2768A9|nr:NADPH-dependent F420 reductase [Methanospirillum sp.]HOJ95985.1 NADPH-dependent F420 reductase [Methanospirillum sp.]HOL41077.1 NADPH-dependent F420 reductase [Methanospirillum sp.]HPP77313.1 NADPH-dependent F420 reductase [Methanospirillum sp.]
MRVGIVGGTGEIGEGMALRLSRIMDVCVGSRDPSKAQETCDTCLISAKERGIDCSVQAGSNQEVVSESDVIILAIPFRHLESTVRGITGWEEKIVISPVNPMERREYFVYTPPAEGSAALFLQKILPPSTRICTAFNNIAGNRWRDITSELEYSVPVCGDDPEAKEIVMGLVNQISLLKAYDAGPLATSSIVESITPLLLNIARFNKMKDVGIRFV